MAPGVSSSYYREVPTSISFSGSGFMATYQMGVAQCFLNNAPWLLHTAPCVLGTSAGSLVAAAVVCEISLITMRDEMLHFAKQLKDLTLGPFNPSVNVFHWLEFVLHKHLPSNAHKLASGRLAVAMTRMTDRKLTIMSDFQSREDVLQALLCSCFVPGYCGMMAPSFKGVHYVDGGFTSMQPILNAPCSHILTVSPFSGETDICPADKPSKWDMVVSGATLKGNVANSVRILNALYPTAVEPLEQAYNSGYNDAIHFLLSNDVVPYVITQKESEGPFTYNQTKWCVHQDPDRQQKEEKMEKKTITVTSTSDKRCMQTDSSAKPESTGEQPVKEPAFTFDMMKNVFLGNMELYLGMVGLPARVLSSLILPLTLLFYIAILSQHRLVMLFTQPPELAFWVWCGIRHFTNFFSDVLTSSIKKNLKDRIMPIILLLKWLKSQAQYETPRGQRHLRNVNKFSSSARSQDIRGENQQTQFIAHSQDYIKPKLRYMS
ncbi:uncharacterized protein V6R79_019591 [Siganus canaliculatus]